MATVKKSKKKIIVPICIVLVIAIIAGVIFGVAKSKDGEQVSLYTIAAGDIYEKVSLTGEITAGTVKEYKVATVATVKEVFVKVGDKVNKGDVLATFDLQSLNSEINSLRTDYNDSLNAYNNSVAAQKEAKTKAEALKVKIAETEELVAELQNAPQTTTYHTTKAATKITTTESTTKPQKTTAKTTTAPTTQPTTAPTTRPASTSKADIGSLSDALAELTKTLVQISDDLETIAAGTKVIADAISIAMENGVFDSDVIAQIVGDAISQAMRDGIIDAANILVESDLAVRMVQAAIESIDFEAIAASVMNSKNVSLTAAELQLAAQQAQYTVYSVQADETLVIAQRKSLNMTKRTLDILEQQKKDMENGWIAAFDGTITLVDVTAGMQTNMLSAGIKLENLDAMAVNVSLSEYDLHKVKVGMSAKVSTAYGTYDAEVTSIAPTATGGSSTSMLDNVGSMAGISGLSSLTEKGAGVQCVISIPKTDEFITAGFDANADIATGEYLGVTVVPIESIKLEKTGTYVYLYNEEEGTVTKTQIQTGAISDTVYEVKSGLNPGDRIVSAPAGDYAEDTFKVKVTNK